MGNSIAVYAVADNIISSLGVNTDENLNNIFEQKSGIRKIDEPELYYRPIMAGRLDWNRVESMPMFKLSHNSTKLESLMTASVADALSKTQVDAKDVETIFIFASTKGNIDQIANNKDISWQDVLMHHMASIVSSNFGSPNTPIVVSNACVSGVMAIVMACDLLKSGKYKNAVVVGGDILSEFVISGFDSFKSMSDELCRPYDKDRTGLNLGEGAATLILSTDESLSASYKKVMVSAGSTSNDANHISGPSRTGEELAMAIKDVLKLAGASAEDIDMVDAHGTATVYNDEMESKAMELCGLQNVPMISLKSYFGHTLGASGLIESIVCIECMRKGRIPKTLGFENIGTPVKLNISKESKKANLRNVLKTASGFGGCNAAILLSTEYTGRQSAGQAVIEVQKKCNIKDRKILIDGNVVFDGTECDNYYDFLRFAFKQISPEPYMKFGKMDNLCRLAVTCAEYLLNNVDLSEYTDRDIALLLSCKTSSLETDTQHQAIIEKKDPYQPSPAIFVYTLSNIMQGEICIRHKIKGECICLVEGSLKDNTVVEYASELFSQGRAKVCIAGYADYLDGKYAAQLSLLTPRT